MGLPARDAELVQIMDAALANAAVRAGTWLACRPGCTPCCHGAFAINALDAARLRAGMEALRLTEAKLASAIELRATTWIAEHAPEFPGDPLTGRLGETAQDHEKFENFANDAVCPALDPETGRCDVYAWRPMTCRVFGPPVRMETGQAAATALAHCELCFIGAPQEVVAACEMPVPHDLEDEILAEALADGEFEAETVVAFALLPRR